MRVRALTTAGDWTFGSGQNNYLVGTAAVGQAIATSLLEFLGDCFFDISAGIDWWTFLGGSKNQLALQLAISAVILNVQSQGQSVVSSIQTLDVNLDDETRAFSVTYSVVSIFGAVNGVVTQNLGVGPVFPVINNLLPQFNQTLLNNVGATPINGAMFQGAIFWEVDLPYFIERRSSTLNYNQRGTLFCVFDVDTQLWSINNFVAYGSSGPTTGVTFSINPLTGQVSYASDNVTGLNYVGNLIIQSGDAFVAGV